VSLFACQGPVHGLIETPKVPVVGFIINVLKKNYLFRKRTLSLLAKVKHLKCWQNFETGVLAATNRQF
jgi:hypothetical protein